MARRIPKLPWEEGKRDNREATSRSDGASLALGSTEYRERVADLAGMDEFEQERQALDAAGLRRSKEFTPEDKHAAKHDSMVGEFADGLKEAFESADMGMLTTSERKVSHEIRKSALVDKAVSHAREVAEQTEDKKDDKFVRRRLPKMLDDNVYDEGKDEEDIYPGMSTLNKYM